jgi:hypothetical protein
MRRKIFDLIASAGGLVVVVVLLVAGGLLMWGYSFASNEVHNQLARQEIYFPPLKTINTPHNENYRSRSVIAQYAGQQVLTGTQANAYAYKVEMDVYTLPYHGVYSKLSAAALQHPTTKKLASLVTVSFRGTTLQGLLLQAYAFGTFATIALWAGIAAFVLAVVLLVLVGLGFWHARRTPPELELLPTSPQTTRPT